MHGCIHGGESPGETVKAEAGHPGTGLKVSRRDVWGGPRERGATWEPR